MKEAPMTASTYTFRIDGMHCPSCPLLIDDTLEDLPGVAASTTSYKQRLAEVQITAGTTPDQVTSAIAALGYRAERAD
jgi:copper chaperone CopZ